MANATTPKLHGPAGQWSDYERNYTVNMLTRVAALNNADLIGVTHEGDNMNVVNLDVALGNNYRNAASMPEKLDVFITGKQVLLHQQRVTSGAFGSLPVACLMGIAVDDDGTQPFMLAYSIPFSTDGTLHFSTSVDLAKSIMNAEFPRMTPTEVSGIGRTYNVRTTAGIVKYGHITSLGGIDIPSWQDIGAPDQISDRHPCLMPRKAIREVGRTNVGFWGVPNLSGSESRQYEDAYDRWLDGRKDTGFNPDPSVPEDPMGDELPY